MAAACDQSTCLFCGGCVSVCPPDCITVYENSLVIDEPSCTSCGLCVTVCPVGALWLPVNITGKARPVATTADGSAVTR